MSVQTHHAAHVRASAEGAARAAVRAAHRALRNRHDADDPATRAWRAAIADWHRAWDACLPAGYWDAFADLKQTPDPRGGWTPANPASIETAILFLEEDAMFFRSGYMKASIIQRLKRQRLSTDQIDRLGGIVLAVVDRRHTNEFRSYGRLACHVATPALRDALATRRAAPDPWVRRRAGWVLAAMAQAKGPGA